MKQREKYNIFTAIAMVVGSVIGSGVFFKAETVVKLTGGNSAYGVGAWMLGGMSMVFCLLSFGIISEFVEGKVDLTGIAGETAGRGYGYFSGWFMSTVYYPSLSAVLSWLCADYTLQMAGIADNGGLCMTLSGVLLVVSFAQNMLFPKASGKVQIITTVLKLIPLIIMIVLGTGRGILSEFSEGNSFLPAQTDFSAGVLFSSVSAVMFAYEGWIAALCIGPELENREKNLPKALIIGGVAVLAVYVLYYIGILGAIPSKMLINYGRDGIKTAFSNVVGERLSGLLLGFVAISCYGALNGMMFGLGRSMYSLADRNAGPCPKLFSEISEKSGMPFASFTIGLVFAFLWLFFLFGSSLSSTPIFGDFRFDISEIPVVTVYAMYIPIFVCALKKWGNKLNFVKRGIIFLGIASCFFTAISALIAHINDMGDYLVVFTVIMLVGEFFRKNSE